jgi:hypothetical protein
MTGYSRVMPLAPRTVRALRATSSAARTLWSFPKLTCSGVQAAFVLDPPEVQGEHQAGVDRDQHAGKLLLGDLEGGYRLAELRAVAGVFKRRFDVGAGGAGCSPDDPVARFVEA